MLKANLKVKINLTVDISVPVDVQPWKRHFAISPQRSAAEE